VIWNFEDATNITVNQWHGAVLAGDATVTNGSPMEGFLYAKNFVGAASCTTSRSRERCRQRFPSPRPGR
jgi:choice-of-anchor A domain-containing protein